MGAIVTEWLFLGACLCFQLLLEFTAGTGKGIRGEVNGLQGKGRSCQEKERWKERRREEGRKGDGQWLLIVVS